MAAEPLIERREVTVMLFAVLDINEHVRRILYLLEDYLDGEEEVPEDDA